MRVWFSGLCTRCPAMPTLEMAACVPCSAYRTGFNYRFLSRRSVSLPRLPSSWFLLFSCVFGRLPEDFSSSCILPCLFLSAAVVVSWSFSRGVSPRLFFVVPCCCCRSSLFLFCSMALVFLMRLMLCRGPFCQRRDVKLEWNAAAALMQIS